MISRTFVKVYHTTECTIASNRCSNIRENEYYGGYFHNEIEATKSNKKSETRNHWTIIVNYFHIEKEWNKT